MTSFVLATVFSIALALPAMAGDQKGGEASKRAVNNQTAVACNLCFTCGGDWPVFAGALPTLNSVSERGSGCSGAFVSRTDNPRLCCR